MSFPAPPTAVVLSGPLSGLLNHLGLLDEDTGLPGPALCGSLDAGGAASGIALTVCRRCCRAALKAGVTQVCDASGTALPIEPLATSR